MNNIHELLSLTACTCDTDGVECLDGVVRCLRCRADVEHQALLYQRTRGWAALSTFAPILEVLKEELICEGEKTKRLDWLRGLAKDANLLTAPPPDPKAVPRRPRFQLVLAWYDAWIGVYYSRTEHRLYGLPIPFCGVSIGLPSREDFRPLLRTLSHLWR